MSSVSGTLASIVRELIADASLLVRQEIRLVKAELAEKAERVQKGLYSIAAGMLLAVASLLILLQALVVALANFMPPSVAALIVGLAVGLVAFILMRTGQQALDPDKLKPERTLLTVRDDNTTPTRS